MIVSCDSGERSASVPKLTASACCTMSMSWCVYRMWSHATFGTIVYSGMPLRSATSTVPVGHALRCSTVWMPAFSVAIASSSPSSSSPTALIE